MLPVHAVSTEMSSPYPCSCSEPGRAIWSRSGPANQRASTPTSAGSRANDHAPARFIGVPLSARRSGAAPRGWPCAAIHPTHTHARCPCACPSCSCTILPSARCRRQARRHGPGHRRGACRRHSGGRDVSPRARLVAGVSGCLGGASGAVRPAHAAGGVFNAASGAATMAPAPAHRHGCRPSCPGDACAWPSSSCTILLSPKRRHPAH